MKPPLDTNSIVTVSGREVNFLDPAPGCFVIFDVAHALAKAPRWCGHTDMDWTVAEHSMLVAELARLNTREISREIYLGLLLHDATEAFLADIPSPVKRLLPDYQKVEERLYYAIYRDLHVPPPPCDVKKHWDRVALLLEARDLFHVPRRPVDFGVEDWPDYPKVFTYVDPLFDGGQEMLTSAARMRGVFCALYATGPNHNYQTSSSPSRVRVGRQREQEGVGPGIRQAERSIG